MLLRNARAFALSEVRSVITSHLDWIVSSLLICQPARGFDGVHIEGKCSSIMCLWAVHQAIWPQTISLVCQKHQTPPFTVKWTNGDEAQPVSGLALLIMTLLFGRPQCPTEHRIATITHREWLKHTYGAFHFSLTSMFPRWHTISYQTEIGLLVLGKMWSLNINMDYSRQLGAHEEKTWHADALLVYFYTDFLLGALNLIIKGANTWL